MILNRVPGTVTVLKMVTLLAITSCESQDRRLAEYAQRATDQQARQNEHLAQQSAAILRQTQEVAAAAHDLVEQDAVARRDLIQAQDKLHAQQHVERSAIEAERQALHGERKAAAQAAVRDPVIAQAVLAGGLLLAALLPLLVTAYALRRLPPQRPVDELLDRTLIETLITGQLDVAAVECGPPSLLDSTGAARLAEANASAPDVGSPGA